GITQGPDGNLWFTEYANNAIAKVTTGGAVTTYTIPGTGNQPENIATGPDGNLWFVESSGTTPIGRFNPNTLVFTMFGLPGGRSGSDVQDIVAGMEYNMWSTWGGSIARTTQAGPTTSFNLTSFPAMHKADAIT